MTTFNDLIAELTKENLLDEVNILLPEKLHSFNASGNPVDTETPLIPIPDLLTFSETYDLKLPDFKVLKPEADSHFEANQIKNVFSVPDPTITFQNTQNLIKYQTRRHRVKRVANGKKYCSTCGVQVSQLSFHCQFCRQKVVSELYYYSIIMLAFTIFTVMVWVIVTSKSYN